VIGRRRAGRLPLAGPGLPGSRARRPGPPGRRRVRPERGQPLARRGRRGRKTKGERPPATPGLSPELWPEERLRARGFSKLRQIGPWSLPWSAAPRIVASTALARKSSSSAWGGGPGGGWHDGGRAAAGCWPAPRAGRWPARVTCRRAQLEAPAPPQHLLARRSPSPAARTRQARACGAPASRRRREQVERLVDGSSSSPTARAPPGRADRRGDGAGSK
jgi:hypothetical protein